MIEITTDTQTRTRATAVGRDVGDPPRMQRIRASATAIRLGREVTTESRTSGTIGTQVEREAGR